MRHDERSDIEFVVKIPELEYEIERHYAANRREQSDWETRHDIYH